MKKALLSILFLLMMAPIWAQQKALQIICKPPIKAIAGQSIKLQVKVAHQLKEEKTGTLSLSLINHATGKSVDGWFINIFPFQYFTTIDKENFEVEFPFTVPHEFKGSFDIELVAKVPSFTDSVRFTVVTSSKK
ncbi:MAG: hypothetical protein RL387_1127 [Bacteroidota bacterium]|jgi:hypothetical protein